MLEGVTISKLRLAVWIQKIHRKFQSKRVWYQFPGESKKRLVSRRFVEFLDYN